MMKNRKTIKRIVLAALVMSLVLSMFSACGKQEKAELSASVEIAALNGPTGIGMVKMMEQTDKYHISIYQSPDEVVGKIISGEVNLASVPSNLAAVLYNKTEGQILAVSPNTLGVLYIVENNAAVAELKDIKGKTILASGKGGAPEYILNRLLLNKGIDPEKDVTIQWMANHTDVTSALLSGGNTIALLPEPFVSVVMNKNKAINIAVDLNAEWKSSYQMDLPMGVLVARKDFIYERGADLDILMEDYKKSVDFVNNNEGAAALVSKYGLIKEEGIALTAIPKCNIVISDDSVANQEMLNKFFEILYEMEPKSIGGQIPDEAFYYNWTK